MSRRRPDWDALQALLDRRRAGTLQLEDLRRLDQLYRRATADLAQAQAHYAGTDAHRFLNQLCGAGYAAIYRVPAERWTDLLRFFRRGFPARARAELRYIGASAGLLLFGTLIGACLGFAGPEAARVILPQHLLDDIAEHRVWTDSIVSAAPGATSRIATNNLTVTVLAFGYGITLGLGTAFLLLANGMMLGAVIVLCVREGMGYSLFSFIGGHGPVELSVIAIAGGAGLAIAHAIIDPGERPRGEHLRVRALEAVQLVLGSAPFLALIAVIEGFVSPGQFFPGWMKIALGFALGSSFWAYLLWAGRADPTTTTSGSASGRRFSR